MEPDVKAISQRKYDFVWSDPMHTTSVQVTLPNLAQLECSVWGDWGKMYEFRLTEVEFVTIKYNFEETNYSQRILQIESPMAAKEREMFPFFLTIEDREKGLRFQIYLRKDYEMGKVEVLRREDRVKLFERKDSEIFSRMA